ncbi:hypothetical protein [Streptomyces mayteni]
MEERVRAQIAGIAAYAFTIFLPLILVALTLTSAWTGWVNVMAMHTYLERPHALPGATWAVPIAVQTFVIVGEATMVLNSVLRRRWIVLSGAAATVSGYGVEIAAHIYYGEGTDTIVVMIVAAVACGGGWALMAGLMDRGVEIANGETLDHELPAKAGPPATPTDDDGVGHPNQARPATNRGTPTGGPPRGRRVAPLDHATESPPTLEAGGADSASASLVPAPQPERITKGRRSRTVLLREVRELAPDHTKLSPNFVAERIGVSWSTAKALLNETGRLLNGEPTSTVSESSGDLRPPPSPSV